MEIDVPQPTEPAEVGEQSTVPFKIIDAFYTNESGHGPANMPIVHLSGRTPDGRTSCRVTQFYPFFYISESEFIERRTDIEREMEKRQSNIIDYETGFTGMGQSAIEGDIPIVKIYVDNPKKVGGESGMKNEFRRTWEADIPFVDRFLTSMGVNQYVRIPRDLSGTQYSRDISVTQLEPIEDEEQYDIKPNVFTADIEVLTEGSFPDYENPTQPITAIATHESQSDEYRCFVLKSSEWPADSSEQLMGLQDHIDDERLPETSVTVYSDESQLLHDFWQTVLEYEIDVLSGWNSDEFDYPYLINRTLRKRIDVMHQLDEKESDVSWIRDAPRETQYAARGVVFLDSMSAIKSTDINERKTYTLDGVANEELGWGKADIEADSDSEQQELDWAYYNQPLQFVAYNIIDTKATARLREESDVLPDFDNFAAMSGVRYGEALYNKNLIDGSLIRWELPTQGSET